MREKQKSVAATTADVEMRARAEGMIEKAEGYLRSHQDKETGGWSLSVPDKDGQAKPQIPGITALVINGMLMDPTADPEKDANIAAGLRFLLKYQQPDGGIYDRVLPCYNTSLAVSALSKVHTARAREAVDKGVAFLKNLQWREQVNGTLVRGDTPKPVEGRSIRSTAAWDTGGTRARTPRT